MRRLLSYVLEQMGFPEEPGIEMRDRCPHVVSVDRVMTMPVHFHIRQRDREEVPGEEAEDAHRDDPPAPEPEVQRSPTLVLECSPPSPPHTTSAAAPTDTPGPSYLAHQSLEYTHVSSSDGCDLHTSSHSGSPACSPRAEVDPVLHYASADHDPPGSSS